MNVYPKTLCIKCHGWNLVQYPMGAICEDCNYKVELKIPACPKCGVNHTYPIQHLITAVKYEILWFIHNHLGVEIFDGTPAKFYPSFLTKWITRITQRSV